VSSWQDLLLGQLVFLATASDDEVHPDLAIAQSEALVLGVCELPAADRDAFVARLRQRLSASSGAAAELYSDLLQAIE
jgi:hypothetical protein